MSQSNPDSIRISQDLFRKINGTIWVIVAFYTCLCFYFKAWFTGLCLLSGITILQPLVLQLIRRSAFKRAGILCVGSCLFYVLSFMWGIEQNLFVEYYFFPCALLVLIMFDFKDRLTILLGVTTPLVIAVASLTLHPLSDTLLSPAMPTSLFRNLNFIGSFVVSLIFMHQFLSAIDRHRSLSLEESRALNLQLMETNRTIIEKQGALATAESVARLGHWSFDLSSGKIRWSRQMFELFPEEVETGEPDFERHRSTIHPDDRDHWQKIVEDCVKTGKPYTMRFRCLHPDRTVWIEARGQGTQHEGKIVGIFGTCQDISALVESEHKLQGQTNLLHKVFETISEGLVVFDQQGRIRKSNSAAAGLQGYPNFFKSDGQPLIPSEYPEQVALRSGSPEKNLIYTQTLPDGKTRWYNVNAMPMSEADAEIGQVLCSFRDMTQQKQSMTELELMNQRLQFVLENLSLGSWEYDFITGKSSYDRIWCEILGLQSQDVAPVNASWEDRVHPEDKMKIYEAFQSHLDGKTRFYENIHRLRHADGHWVWILTRGRIVERDAEGRPLKLSGTHTDITQQMEVEQELRKTKSEIEAFFGASLNPLCIAEQDGSFKRVNPAFTAVLGYTIEDLRARSFFDFVFPDEAAAARASALFQLERQSPEIFESRYTTRSGEVRRLSWIISCDPSTRILYAAARDVTTERKTERELRQLLNAIYESALVTITDQSGRILDINEKYCKASGYTQQELLGQNHHIFSSGVHSRDFWDDLWKTILSGRSWTGEICNKSKSGHKFWVHTAITPLYNENAQLDRFLSILFETTEQKLAEKKLLESAKMASLGEMAGGIAHEINNPLAIILGRSAQIKRLLDRNDMKPDFLITSIKQIESTAERISRIVRGLRTFSRNAEQDPMVPVALEKIITETLELCRERFRHHGIDLRIHSTFDIGIECRASQVSQIIMNLLNNAHDAVINLPDKWVDIAIVRQGEQVVIRIMDSGHGIPHAIADKIMDPFFTTKEIGVGTGLGLSISKALALGHGGQLRYEPNGPHTLFILELPLSQDKALAS